LPAAIGHARYTGGDFGMAIPWFVAKQQYSDATFSHGVTVLRLVIY
jgi:hypothetical protein